MSMLSGLSRTLFRWASLANRVNVWSSLNPGRIGRHLVRRQALKGMAGIGRYSGRRRRRR